MFAFLVDFCVKLIWNGVIALILGVSSTVLGNFVPRTWINYNVFPYRNFTWEKDGKFYLVFGIEYWKERLPDISEYIKSVFPKRTMNASMHNSGYLKRFAKETCISETVHWLLILVSPVYYVFNNDHVWGISVMIIDIVTNIPFIMVQRFNRPRLVKLAERSERHKSKSMSAEQRLV